MGVRHGAGETPGKGSSGTEVGDVRKLGPFGPTFKQFGIAEV